MKQILVSGSTAFDIHMNFSESFAEHFSLGDMSENVNLSTVSEVYNKYHGGTGANIAYNLGLLGEHSILLTSIGESYKFSEIIREKTNLKYVHRQRDEENAQSINISDTAGNKMTFFYPGAMKYASDSKIDFVEENIGVAIVSANHIPTMIHHAKELSEKGIPVVLDPAQQVTQMQQGELREYLSYGNILIANHHEFNDIQKVSGYSENELSNMFEYLIITYGSQGSQISGNKQNIHISAIEVPDIDDTTGAGDAYRAGILFGIIEGIDIKVSAQLGTLLAAYSLYTPGSQQHHISFGTLMEDMKEKYGVSLDLYSKRKY